MKRLCFNNCQSDDFKACGRSQAVGRFIKKVYKKGYILDIGCASGYFIRDILRKYGCKTLGVDINFTDILRARSFCDKVVVADACNLPFKNCSVETIVCMETLEHISNDDAVLQGFDRIIKESGYLVITVPSANLRYLDPVNILYKIKSTVGMKSTHFHLRHYKIDFFCKKLSNFDLIEYRHYQLFTIWISILYGLVPSRIRNLLRIFLDPIVNIEYRFSYPLGICLFSAFKKK
ncbi:MAG: class I SAM-dependent methyltransferase [Candidatus Hydrogenedentota bacterium]